MPSTINRELQVGDVIEIVRHDKRCRMNLRRVKLVKVVKKHNRYEVIASNLQNENAWDYVLLLEPWTRIICEPNNVGWFYFQEDAEFDG